MRSIILRQTRVLWLLIPTLVFLFMPRTAVNANAATLLISEYVEGSSNNKAIEIYNGTGAAIDLATGNYTLAFYFNGEITPGNEIALTGTVADGDVFVVADQDAATAILDETDQQDVGNFFNGDDVVLLEADGIVIDSIGQLGADPGSEWGTGDTSTQDNTIRRSNDVCAGDANPDDVYDPTDEWSGFAENTFDGLGTHSANCIDTPPEVTSTTPADMATEVPVASDIVVNFSEDVTVTGTWYEVICTTSGTLTATVTGGPQSFTLDPDSDFAEGETCTITVFLSNQVTDQDGTPDNGTQDYTFSFSVFDSANDTAPEVIGTAPVDAATDVPLDSDITINFSESVAVSGTWYDITCNISGARTATVNGGPSSYTLNPDGNFDAGEDCTVTIFAAGVADEDGTPNNLTADYTFGFSTFAPPALTCDSDNLTPIYTIQGAGDSAAVTGLVETAGVVTGDYQDGYDGFYIQSATGDDDPATSDGIFIYDPDTLLDVMPGMRVAVRGVAEERFSQTQIDLEREDVPNSLIVPCGTTANIAPVTLDLPFDSINGLEAYEGMRVTFSETLTVTENFNLGRFGEVWLSSGSRLYNPTNIAAPGAPAQAVEAANNLNRILLDDGSSIQNPDPVPYLFNGPTLRLGDTVTNLTGVLGYGFGNYRVQPTQQPVFVRSNPRPLTLPSSGEPMQPSAGLNLSGSLRAVSFNLGNYFTTLGERGAETTAEFERQRERLITAIVDLNADIIAVQEVENNGFGSESAITDLVAGLNEATAPGTYGIVAPIGLTQIGTDAITVGIIYNTNTVTETGTAAVLDNVTPFNINTRPPLAQTFEEIATGEIVTVVSNHFKSKSTSGCPDTGANADQGDGQGCWNGDRVLASQELLNWLGTNPTGSNDPDILILGDLNAYAQEDPITTLEMAGYTNLVPEYQGVTAYSYVFFGESGLLDHGLANNTLYAQVASAGVYHINTDEPRLYNYDAPNIELLEVNPRYRASDHDPIVIGLNLYSDDAAPVLQLLQPTGTISDGFGDPTYAWPHVDDAISYEFYLGRLPNYTTVALLQNMNALDAETYCLTDTCQIDLTDLGESYRLYNGDYEVWLRPRTAQGPGTWTRGGRFTLDATAPQIVTLQETTGTETPRPTLRWELEDTASWATYFQLYVAPSADIGNPVFLGYISREEACGGTETASCSYTFATDLTFGETYQLWMESGGPGGSAVGGEYPTAPSWVGPEIFVIDDGTLPQLPQNITVDPREGRPIITWDADPNATRFSLYLGPNPIGADFFTIYDAPDICDITTCTVEPPINYPASGNPYQLWMQARGPAGVSAGGTDAPSAPSWIKGPDVNLPTDPAGLPIDIAFVDASADDPALQWTNTGGAIWFQVIVTTTDYDEAYILGWFPVDELECFNAGDVCVLQDTTDVNWAANTDYFVYLQTWGPGGLSTGGLPAAPSYTEAQITYQPTP